MKIIDVNATEFTVGYIEPWANDKRFYAKADTQTNVIVKITAEDGTFGIGECAHAPGVYGETAAATLGALDLLREHIVGKDANRITRITADLDRVSLKGNVAARAGIDIALHDLLGKLRGVPLYDLLGGRVHTSVPTHQSPALHDEVPAQVAGYLEEGTRFFKLKMSGDLSYDMPIVEQVSEIIKGRALLSLDVNQGWTVHDGLRMARFIERLPMFRDNIMLEQPVHSRDTKGMARITQATSVRVLADDGIATVEDLIEIIEMGAADVVSLKISRVGGIQRVRQMIAVAEAFHMPYIVDEINEFRIAATAVAHVAVASRHPLYTGTAAHTHHDLDVVTEGGVQIVDGDVVLPDQPGLGIGAIAVSI